jgi:polar amino acid transport system substrate-binding protein
VLTVATDSPAYPPYFENNKPANGKGFESAVAYAVAAKLGSLEARPGGS